MELIIGLIICFVALLVIVHNHGKEVAKKIGANPQDHSIKEGLRMARERQDEIWKKQKRQNKYYVEEDSEDNYAIPIFANQIIEITHRPIEQTLRYYGFDDDPPVEFYLFFYGVFSGFADFLVRKTKMDVGGPFERRLLTEIGERFGGEDHGHLFQAMVLSGKQIDNPPPSFTAGFSVGVSAAIKYYEEKDTEATPKIIRTGAHAQFGHLRDTHR
ncbi:hypothetical protein [Halorhodospira sp. 9622]|uniref:hypothetical protein n=1 Tax=Halorhodospira sp. 9622 TaxID=2899136 RepID=UPI001EE8CB51|nr:hypothetical protein [Halorhodospira sp. 9622]MCG5538360.1 hypothetical protein [Halorhodospira sp. 9622]